MPLVPSNEVVEDTIIQAQQNVPMIPLDNLANSNGILNLDEADTGENS